MESKPKARHDTSPEKESLQKNKVRLFKNIIFYKKIQILIPKNIKDNNENIIQEKNDKNISPSRKHNSHRACPKIISGKPKKDIEKSENLNSNITDCEEVKMDIEVNCSNKSNELTGSLSTNASNNNYFSKELKNLNNLNICSNTNIIFVPEKNNNQNEIQSQRHIQINLTQNDTENKAQISILNKPSEQMEKEIFKFNFSSAEESISFAGEYLNEIYSNLLQDEKDLLYKPKIGYMNMQSDINEQMRAILIDWLIEVHYRYRLKSETLYQTVWIIDTYLSMLPIVRARLQLLGIASLLISCKSQEIYYPQLNELIDITDGAYVKDELVKIETHILKVLSFNIVAPTANDFYNIIAKSFNFDNRQFYLGKYFLESSLIDYQMIRYPSSVVAVSCAYIVMKFFGISNYKNLYSTDVINENCPQKIIKECAREVCFLVKNLSQSTLKAVKDKYSLPQFLNVAQYCEQK